MVHPDDFIQQTLRSKVTRKQELKRSTTNTEAIRSLQEFPIIEPSPKKVKAKENAVGKHSVQFTDCFCLLFK